MHDLADADSSCGHGIVGEGLLHPLLLFAKSFGLSIG